MKIVIAEKPSVAREIARHLGAEEKREGYLTGNGYFVTWAYGHLVALGMPEDYGCSGFQKSSLPILPNPFILTVRKVKKDKVYSTDALASRQLKLIKYLLDRSESIIVATDAGREGELIFRYIYEYLKCKLPFERLWISSLTEKAIKRGFENLTTGSDFDGLYLAGQSRSRADWLVGINASQALSVAVGNGVFSLGRVQTPTLALICRRYFDNANFSVQQYWQIQISHTKEFIDFKSLSIDKWQDKKLVENIVKAIQRSNGIAMVTAIEIKNITDQPPLLFDLTGLQKEANKKLNLTAEETLNIAQSLYEKKFITYPRTGSKYISEDIWTELPNLIRAMQDVEVFKKAVNKIKWGCLNKRIVNDLRVTDHHGLLITGKIPTALEAKENAVYNMIAFRLLESISQVCTKEITDITLQALHYDFAAKGCVILEPGWRSIKGNFTDNDTDLIQELPKLQKGDELKIKDISALQKETRPPSLYTEAGLLSAMEMAGKEIDNEEERKVMQNVGIGTPATRGAMIETLFSRGYIQRENKSLMPTSKGLHVYELVKDKKIADVALTAEWELTLQKIESNEINAEVFQNEIEIYATTITSELLQAAAQQESPQTLICPKCKKQELLVRDKIIKCKDEVCHWVQFRNICGIQLSLVDLEALISTGKTGLLKGMISKSGKKFDAFIVMNENGETSFVFPERKKKK